MVRGHADWFITKTAFGKAMQDVGELGARFGIPYSFTRSGKVVYSDGFESSLSPWQVITGAGYGTATIATDVSFRGNNSLKLVPAAAGLQLSVIDKVIPYVVGGKVGMEALVAGEAAADYARLQLGFRIDDVFTYYAFYLDFTTTTLRYRNSAGDKETALVIGKDCGGGSRYYQLMKIVIDPEKGEYDYIQLNNVRVPLSGISGYSFSNAGIDSITVSISAEDTSGDQGVVYFDDITITVDEP